MNKYIFLQLILIVLPSLMIAQTPQEKYEEFRRAKIKEYSSFRDECNQKYIGFLKYAWGIYEGKTPMDRPIEPNPIPPLPFDEEQIPINASINPIEIIPIKDSPQPKPIEPIKENQESKGDYFPVRFFDNMCNVRLPEIAKLILQDCSPHSISDGWERLCSEDMDNAIRDCLETRIRYGLCDWAYLIFLDDLSRQYCKDSNGATLLMAFLYCQSGYQMRLAVDGNKLFMLFGSKHQIYDKGYFDMDGAYFYPYGEPSNSISICGAAFEGERPLSLLISSEQLLGGLMSDLRMLQSTRYIDTKVQSHVPENLINFYNQYPSSIIDGNMMTRWAMYANTPLAQVTKEAIYPSLKKSIEGLSAELAANKLLNWVQTGFVYEYDDKVWGHDRAFFAEETLYYPYCDCEDRSILFSRLVRDLLGLDVALIYYPGHLATAVCFEQEVQGDAMIIGGRKFIVCDPTYIGAPVGAQMPDLEYDKAQAIILNK
ncbi:MAG: hypothetical protein K2K93_04115 [Muribaculaceae bacterium]|nr:hypothetical protein [Muribaculaceae bacterium]